MTKYINDDALLVQQSKAPNLASFLRPAAELADQTVEKMRRSLSHVTRVNDPKARSGPAHEYWIAYFEFDRLPVGLGYDLLQWKEIGTPDVPWRIIVYQTSDTPVDLSAIKDNITKRGYSLDDYNTTSKISTALRTDDRLWIPVPPEFIRGVTTIPSEFVHGETLVPVLAGAINAFLGSITS